jgi:hypothetical protein
LYITRGLFSLQRMRNTLFYILLSVSVWCSAQIDSSSVDDILSKLSRLEQLKGANDTLSSLKLIADTNYAKALNSDSLPPTNSIDTTALQAIIQFDTATFNLGTIAQGAIAKQKFIFTNVGTEDLEIISVVADCSCTSQDWSKDPVKPGETGYVLATYDSKEDMGRFLKTITVLHNSGEGWTFLEINGFVAPKL